MLDLLNSFNIEHAKIKQQGFYLSGILPIFTGKVINLNTPNIVGDFELDILVKQGDVLNDCKSLRDISAKILVKNTTFEESYKDFKVLSNFKAIDVI